jgi:hypothetical protein
LTPPKCPPWPHPSMTDAARRRSLPDQPPTRTQLRPHVALVLLIGAHLSSAAAVATTGPAQRHERGTAGCSAAREGLMRNSAAGAQPAMLSRSNLCFSGGPQLLGDVRARNRWGHPAASTDLRPAQCRRHAQNQAFVPRAALFPGSMARRASLQPDSSMGLSMATKQGAGDPGRRRKEGRGTGAGAGGGKEKRRKSKGANNWGVSLSGFLADLPFGLARCVNLPPTLTERLNHRFFGALSTLQPPLLRGGSS